MRGWLGSRSRENAREAGKVKDMTASDIVDLRRSLCSPIIFEMEPTAASEGTLMRSSWRQGPASNVCRRASRRYGDKVAAAAIEEISGQSERLGHDFVAALPDGSSKSEGFIGVQCLTPRGAATTPGQELGYMQPQSFSQQFGYVAAQPTTGL